MAAARAECSHAPKYTCSVPPDRSAATSLPGPESTPTDQPARPAVPRHGPRQTPRTERHVGARLRPALRRGPGAVPHSRTGRARRRAQGTDSQRYLYALVSSELRPDAVSGRANRRNFGILRSTLGVGRGRLSSYRKRIESHSRPRVTSMRFCRSAPDPTARSRWTTRSSSARAAESGSAPPDNLRFMFFRQDSRHPLTRREKPF